LAKVVKRRETFEIGSLRAAYFALTRLARAATQYHLLDRAAAESTNSPYGSHRVTDQPGGSEIDEELRVANGEASWSIAMILHDKMRLTGNAAREAFTLLTQGQKTIDQADEDWKAAAKAMQAALDVIAARVREIYKTGLAS
jgi:hypothetical protein